MANNEDLEHPWRYICLARLGEAINLHYLVIDNGNHLIITSPMIDIRPSYLNYGNFTRISFIISYTEKESAL